MSATGTFALSARVFEGSLAELSDWRRKTSQCLADFRRWALVERLIDEQTAARLAHLERRLAVERLTIAFLAEDSRGKSELINALFFSDLGSRLLPADAARPTLCPTEILWDPSRPPSIRLLPVESRESPTSLREYIAEAGNWHEVALDPARPESLAATCAVLSETLSVEPVTAASLGFAVEGDARAEIPRWRYAQVNFPHPLLSSGLAILEMPGRLALGLEPELTVHRVPEAAAIVYLLAADLGATAPDRELWSEHLAPIDGVEQACFIVLNKIDGLRSRIRNEADLLSEIDRLVRSTAEALSVAPTRIFALSAAQGLAAKMAGDRDGLLKSRLYRLEQALAKGMVHERRVDHATAVGAEMRPALAESKTLIASRLAFAEEQLGELDSLQGRNQKLVETLAKKAAGERGRLEQARSAMMGLRSQYNRHADELARLLNPNDARDAAIHARAAVLNSRFSSGIGGALDGFFTHVRDRLEASVGVIAAVRAMMLEARQKFADEYQIAMVEVASFATERFIVELDRLEERCEADFKKPSTLLTLRRKTLGARFFDTIALKTIRIFEIADREVRAWMNGFIRPLDAQLAAFQEQTNARIEGMGRIQHAETDLIERVGELNALVTRMRAQRETWEAFRERLAALLEVEREPSLA